MPSGDPEVLRQLNRNGRLGEAVVKVTADTSEFEAAMQRCLDMVRELNAEVDKLQEKQRKVESND